MLRNCGPLLWLCCAGILLSACPSQPPPTETGEETAGVPSEGDLDLPFDEETLKVQARVNEYFYADVLPNLRECWSRVEGEGDVTLAYDYVRDEERAWAPDTASVADSTLPEDQSQIAVECMNQAIQGTSLPASKGDGAATELALYWRWPVPLPGDEVSISAEDLQQLKKAKACQDCEFNWDTLIPRCKNVWVGWTDCRVDGTVCSIRLQRCYFGVVYDPSRKLVAAQ